MLTTQDLFDYAYYRCTPVVYRTMDKQTDYSLKRYLSALIFGGFSLSLDDVNNLLNLVDPELCPPEYLPLLYECFGLEYFPDVAVEYHRKLLLNYGELLRRKGTYSCVRFLAKILTGLDAKLSYLRGIYDDQDGRHLIIDLQAHSMSEILSIDTSIYIIEQFIGLFVPYYITTHIIGTVVNLRVDVEPRYRAQSVSTGLKQIIRPPIVVKAPTAQINRANTVTENLNYKVVPVDKTIRAVIGEANSVSVGAFYLVHPALIVKAPTAPVKRANTLTSTHNYTIGFIEKHIQTNIHRVSAFAVGSYYSISPYTE